MKTEPAPRMIISEITGYNSGELAAVQNLLAQLSPLCRPIDEARYRALLESRDTHIFFVRDGDIVAGMLSVAFYDIPSGRRAWIEDVVVDIPYREMGLGKMLVAHAIEVAKDGGAANIMLTSNPARIAANGLYRSMGFELKNTNTYTYNLAR